MLSSRHDVTLGSRIPLQFSGNHHARHGVQAFEQLPEKSCGGFCVASALNQDVEYVSILMHCSPSRVLLASSGENHLVHVPFVSTTRAAAQLIGVGLPKFEAPLPDGFISDDDPAVRQNFLTITKTEREAEIQPNSVTDTLRWETETFGVWGSGVCFHEAILAHCSVLLPS